MSTTTTDPPRLFADFIAEQSGGRTHEELSVALAQVAAAVRDTGKKGSLTLSLTLTPVKGESGAIQVADVIKTSVPQPDRRAPLWFATDTGRLTRDDPMQPTFEGLREVPTPTPAAVKTIQRRPA